LTHAFRPIFAVPFLAFGLASASARQSDSLMNWESFKSSYRYTLMADESLDRMVAKTKPNSDLD